MPGPPPKPRSQRRRRNAEPGARTLRKPAAPAAPPAADDAKKPSAKTASKAPASRKRASTPKAPPPPTPPAGKEPPFPLGESAAAATRSWWSTIWASPMADAWLEADVPALARLCTLVELLHTGKISATLFREITALEDRFGLSPKSRRQLGWELEDPAAGDPDATEPKPENVVQLDGERWRRAAAT